ncbi:hypothetical protein FLP15_01940 [Lactococcus protaetiae]|uniref:Uncharacterized protein n=1 Tax=Lactococcus protaetiae TaxID=2592653 RepID=A0A514Z6I1_9LACT|nr:hypothetical protein FLP15_01940 [Lactococcus protaetiae]
MSIPLEIATMISKEAVNKGFINAQQYFELEKEVLGNWVTDEDGGNAGIVPVIDSFAFLKKLGDFSKSKTWGKNTSKLTRIGDVEILVSHEGEEND